MSTQIKESNRINIDKMQTMVKSVMVHCETRSKNARTQVTVPTESPEMERRVSFDPMVYVRRTITRNFYTPEEKQASWYTKEENQEILKRCHKQIRMLNHGERLRDKKYCARGLESHTQLGCLARQRNKRLARESVLTAQAHYGSCNAEAVAEAGQQATASCQLWAQVVGLRDRRAIEDYLEHENVEQEPVSPQPMQGAQNMKMSIEFERNTIVSMSPRGLYAHRWIS
jgi:hypothetical protein